MSIRHYTDIGKQLLLSNDRNRVRGAVLGFSQNGTALICLKIFARTTYCETYRTIPLPTPLFSHWSIPLNKKRSEVYHSEWKKNQKFCFEKGYILWISKASMLFISLLCENNWLLLHCNITNKHEFDLQGRTKNLEIYIYYQKEAKIDNISLRTTQNNIVCVIKKLIVMWNNVIGCNLIGISSRGKIALAKLGREPRLLLLFYVFSVLILGYVERGRGWTRKFPLPGFLTLLV